MMKIGGKEIIAFLVISFVGCSLGYLINKKVRIFIQMIQKERV